MSREITEEAIAELFRTDKDGRFVNLIIPACEERPELNLIGRRQLELSRDEVIRLKIYAIELHEIANGRNPAQ